MIGHIAAKPELQGAFRLLLKVFLKGAENGGTGTKLPAVIVRKCEKVHVRKHFRYAGNEHQNGSAGPEKWHFGLFGHRVAEDEKCFQL